MRKIAQMQINPEHMLPLNPSCQAARERSTAAETALGLASWLSLRRLIQSEDQLGGPRKRARALSPCPQPWLLQMARAQLRARRGGPGWRGRRAPGLWTSLARPAATLAPAPLEELGHMPEPLRQRALTPGTRRGGVGFPESRGQQSWHDQRSFLAALSQEKERRLAVGERAAPAPSSPGPPSRYSEETRRPPMVTLHY